MNIDTTVVRKEDVVSIESRVVIEHAISPSDLRIRVRESESNNEKTLKVVSYIYGRLLVEDNSYFVELCGYISQEEPQFIRYTIVYIDPLFLDRYRLDYSESEFSEEETIEFL